MSPLLTNHTINARQFMILVTLYGIGDSILYIPEMLATDSGQDAWIASGIGFIDSFLFAYLFGKLGSRFAGATFIQYSEILLGKWLGKLISVIFILFIFIDTILMLYEIGDFLLTQFIPRTPIQAIIIIFLCITMQGTRVGVGPLVRASEIFIPWATILLIILGVALLPQINVDRLFPIFEHGLSTLWKSNAQQIGFMSEFAILLMIFANIDRPHQGTKAFILGALLSNLVLFVLTLLAILVLGAELTTKQIYPGFILATRIDVGHFFTRLEAMLATIWFITIFVKTTICFYATTVGVTQLLQLDDHRSLILPLGVLMVPCTLLFVPNNTYYEAVISPFWTYYAFINGVLLPLLLLLIAIFWTRRQRQNL
ncbi:UNVERIFIED_CONTAM: spore germination protein KB [Brevibacillus sp. OAP136]